MKIKNGFRFRITKNNYNGEVTAIDTSNKIATIAFFDNNNHMYGMYSVYISTIINNLETGAYEELKKGE